MGRMLDVPRTAGWPQKCRPCRLRKRRKGWLPHQWRVSWFADADVQTAVEPQAVREIDKLRIGLNPVLFVANAFYVVKTRIEVG